MAEPTLVLSDLLGAQGRLDCGPEPINAIRQGTRWACCRRSGLCMNVSQRGFQILS